MPDQKDKILSYHRAEYMIQNPDSVKLSACIREAYAALSTAAQRTIARGDGQNIRLASAKDGEGKGIFVHLTADTPGEKASVVPSIKTAKSEISVSTVQAPNGTEFMDGDAFLYIVGNDICLCATTMRLGSIKGFLQDLLEKAGVRKDAHQFEIHNALDVDKVAAISEIGVKSINLRGDMYAESAHYMKRKNHVAGILGAITRNLRAFVSTEHDVQPDALKVSLVIDLDERQRGQQLGFQRIRSLATDLVQNKAAGDDYVITLRNGDKINPEDFVHRTTAKIDAVGKSVDRDKAWTTLAEYYKRLTSEGAHVQ